MSVINKPVKPYTFIDGPGNVAYGSQVNGNFDVIYNKVNDVIDAVNTTDYQTLLDTAQEAIDAKDATVALYDNFDDRYLGSKAVEPTLDNDGNALVAGALYFNTVSNLMKVYTGSVWQNTANPVDGDKGDVTVSNSGATWAVNNSTKLNGQSASYYQPASTAITTSNIDSQSVNYASSAGNADTLDGQHASAFASNAPASDTTAGIIELATDAEAITGTVPDKAITPATMMIARPNLMTSVSATGTAVDFTGIPEWVSKVTILIAGVSTAGTSNPLIKLGTSSGIVSSGYTASSWRSPVDIVATSTAGIPLSAADATNRLTGSISITRMSANVWQVASSIVFDAVGGAILAGGYITLASALTQLRITTANGTDTFDAGTINVMYE